ncbi:transketolase [Pantoea sp. Mhis]|uniref:transketolase n=1 Tax=Pantoea sp. Mhis TaxID=2576759 RepID=UPI00135B1507|nr:transketolase [Pantoea sp. Mhis]MXP56685.1 transketolase [Pantoea sp. Mhis]
MFAHKELANAIRVLTMDAVQRAQSGHPGTPMGMADIAEVLWREFLNHNPTNPLWINRDRFILSNGHGSMLLYSLLHLTGYDVSMDELRNFRQLYSKTPGHPEYGCTPGVESTTGPLGQGIANAVGLAIAERTLAAQFNRPSYKIVDHNTYVFMGDGCMMEGISHEVCSIAGTLNLGKLIVFYDQNGISIDGKVKNWFTDDTAKRFESYGWHVIKSIDGHNNNDIKEAILEAKNIVNKPSLLICKTIIGFGSPNKSGTHNIHGAPLGDNEIVLARKQLNWNYAPFEIPTHIYVKWDAKKAGKDKENIWNKQFEAYSQEYPKIASEFNRRINNILPTNWFNETFKFIQKLQQNPIKIATRKASQNTIEEFSKILPEYFGGSADLAPSNLTMCSRSQPINKNANGNYIHYGVREFGMTAISNGIALHGGFLPYSATFLVFMEYAHNAIRMASLMKIRHIMIYTHDSIGLGEDGPTHQPVEQLVSLRSIPNITVWRPCDQVESAIAWKDAVERNGPSVLIFSRQDLMQQYRTIEQLEYVARGGYILKDCHDNKPDLILIATGSEIELAVGAYIQLINEGYKVRVVSMPSTNIFDRQDAVYREQVLPKNVTARIAIEASSADFWIKYTGLHGLVIGMNNFGASAPAQTLFDKFGFTVSNVVTKAKSIL